MDKYEFDFDAVSYAFRPLTQEVKEQFVMPIRGEYIRRAKALLQAKQIEPADFVEMRTSALGIEFASEACLKDMSTDAGAKRLIRLLIIRGTSLPDDIIDRMYIEQQISGTSINDAFSLMSEDCCPKVKTPPAST